MRYALLICDEDKRQAEMSEDEAGAQMAAYAAFGEEMGAKGVLTGGERLQPAATATTVRVRDGERMLTDGPYAELKEQIGGYYVLECKDLDEALEWAAQIPEAAFGAVEVRPVMNYEAYES